MLKVLSLAMLALCVSHPAAAQTNDAAFSSAVRSYVALHNSAADGLPRETGDPAAAASAERMLAGRIQDQRKNPRAGEILGPASDIVRRAVAEELAGPRGQAIRSSIEQDNVHGVRLRVNHRYPPGLPRVTMPGSILAKLPALPSELEYRFLGRSLALVDTQAGLVVDVLPDVLPPPGR